jgi:SsrA-binding protein
MGTMIENRKARFEYELLDEYKTGIVLSGSEIKSIRDGKASIAEAYCLLVDGEMFIRNMHVDPYDKARDGHEPRRDRKLLLTKKELKKISAKMIDKGLAIIPLRLEIDELVKVQIAVSKGKKLYDKRQTIKDRDVTREMQRK